MEEEHATEDNALELDAIGDRPPHVILTATHPIPTEVIYDEQYKPILVSPMVDDQPEAELPPVVEVSTYVEIKEGGYYGEHDHVVKEEEEGGKGDIVASNKECAVPGCDGQMTNQIVMPSPINRTRTTSIDALSESESISNLVEIIESSSTPNTIYNPYESATIAQAPALQAIGEHEVLDVDTTALLADEEPRNDGIDIPEYCAPHFFIEALDDETTSNYIRQLSAGGSQFNAEDLANDPILNAIIAEQQRIYRSKDVVDPLKRCSSEGGQIWRKFSGWVAKYGAKSSAVSRADSTESVNHMNSNQRIDHRHIMLLMKYEQQRHSSQQPMSSRGSISSDNSAATSHTKRGGWSRKGGKPAIITTPMGVLVPRSKRFLTKGTAGFLMTKGNSEINVRPVGEQLLLDTSTMNAPCMECPHCRKFVRMGVGLPVPLHGQCPCHICMVISRGATNLRRKTSSNASSSVSVNYQRTQNRVDYERAQHYRSANTPDGIPSEFGVFCPHCSQLNLHNAGASGEPHGKCAERLLSVPNQACERASLTSGGHPTLQPNIVVEAYPTPVDGPSINTSTNSLFFDSRSSVAIGRHKHDKLTEGRPVYTTQQSCMSTVSNVSAPFCRICHQTDNADDTLLMTPCRCSGTLKFVHVACLLHWLEICHKKYRRKARCEICHYCYKRRRVVKAEKWFWPSIRPREKFLHFATVGSAILMILCAAAIIICFTMEEHDAISNRRGSVDLEMNPINIVTLASAFLFFSGFAVAMYAQAKADYSVYRLCRRIWLMNHEWRIESYDAMHDGRVGRERRQRQLMMEENKVTERKLSVISCASSERSFNRYIHHDTDSLSLDSVEYDNERAIDDDDNIA